MARVWSMRRKCRHARLIVPLSGRERRGRRFWIAAWSGQRGVGREHGRASVSITGSVRSHGLGLPGPSPGLCGLAAVRAGTSGGTERLFSDRHDDSAAGGVWTGRCVPLDGDDCCAAAWGRAGEIGREACGAESGFMGRAACRAVGSSVWVGVPDVAGGSGSDCAARGRALGCGTGADHEGVERSNWAWFFRTNCCDSSSDRIGIGTGPAAAGRFTGGVGID